MWGIKVACSDNPSAIFLPIFYSSRHTNSGNSTTSAKTPPHPALAPPPPLAAVALRLLSRPCLPPPSVERRCVILCSERTTCADFRATRSSTKMTSLCCLAAMTTRKTGKSNDSSKYLSTLPVRRWRGFVKLCMKMEQYYATNSIK